MPQLDRYKKRTLNIEFIASENFNNIPYKDQFSLIFITEGSITGMLNERPVKVSAPCILCISKDDKIKIYEK